LLSFRFFGHTGKRRTTTAKDTGRGVPQGAPISPLLANLYMRRFVLGWKKRGLEARFGAKIVSYADDFVICCKGSAEQAMTRDATAHGAAQADGQ
jgi:RNA-directed DNA polymerase